MKASKRLPKIIFLTGAGLSADSGMKTFRGAGGLYSGMSGEELMSARTLKQQPELLHRFCDELRVELGQHLPNPAHELISRTRSKYGNQVIHFTQNFDDLSERAGDSDVIHLHGELVRLRSVINSKDIRDIGYRRYWDGPAEDATADGYRFRCSRFGALYRPDIVLFGERAPRYAKLWSTFKHARRDDLVIVIGTQGSVLPVNELCIMAPGPKILVNLHESPDIEPLLFRHCFFKRAAEACETIEALIDEHVDALNAGGRHPWL